MTDHSRVIKALLPPNALRLILLLLDPIRKVVCWHIFERTGPPSLIAVPVNAWIGDQLCSFCAPPHAIYQHLWLFMGTI